VCVFQVTSHPVFAVRHRRAERTAELIPWNRNVFSITTHGTLFRQGSGYRLDNCQDELRGKNVPTCGFKVGFALVGVEAGYKVELLAAQVTLVGLK
jgi:hypothetical protein